MSSTDSRTRFRDPDGRKISEIFADIARHHGGPRISLGEMTEALGDRGFGLLMLVFALPMATPMSAIPGISTVFGLPLIVLTVQLAIGLHRPRFPDFLLNRSIAAADFAAVSKKIIPWIERAERVTRPRMAVLTGYLSERLIGLVGIVLTIIMSLPIVLGNQPPAAALSLFAIGMLERDGLFVILGWIATIAAIVIVSAVLGAFAAAAYLVFLELFR